MEYIIYIFGSAFVVMLVSLIGIIFAGQKLGFWLNKNIQLLVSFSAGVFLVISYQLINETFEHASWQVAGLAILGGIILTALLHKFLPETHHHEGQEECKHHVSANRLLFGDSLHNVTDGFILVSAYLISIEAGIALTIGIIIHEAIQEISEFFVYKKAGLSNKKALLLNFISSGSILFGVIIGLFVTTKLGEIESIILGLAAGSFLYIFIIDLLPNIKKTIWFAVLGAILFSGITFLSGGHEHGHEPEEEHDEELNLI